MKQTSGEHIVPGAMKKYIDRKMTEHLEHLGIQGSQCFYLLAIFYNRGASLKEIATYMMVDKSITTRTFGVLMEMGFVINESDDLRRYSIVLTEKGEQAVESINASLRKIWNYLLSDLTDEERKVFRSTYDKINAKLNEEYSEPKED